MTVPAAVAAIADGTALLIHVVSAHVAVVNVVSGNIVPFGAGGAAVVSHLHSDPLKLYEETTGIVCIVEAALLMLLTAI